MRDEKIRPTIRDVAAYAGVSKSLVSLAFKDPSKVSDIRREKILSAAQELGYTPNFLAQSLANDGVPFVGIIVVDLHNPVFAEIADAARAVLDAAGEYSLITAATAVGQNSSVYGRVDSRVMSMFQDLRPKGLLMIGTIEDSSVIPTDIPVVFASSVLDDVTKRSVVRVDDEAALALLVDHLQELGHTNIGFVGGEDGAVSVSRAQSYRAAVQIRGLDPVIISSGYSEESGYRAGQNIIEKYFVKGIYSGPSAFIAVNDLAAMGLMRALEEAGLRVPEDVALTGFDNTNLARHPRVSLTSIDPDNAAIGSQAAEILLDVMGGSSEAEIAELVAPELKIRKTTGHL